MCMPNVFQSISVHWNSISWMQQALHLHIHTITTNTLWKIASSYRSNWSENSTWKPRLFFVYYRVAIQQNKMIYIHDCIGINSVAIIQKCDKKVDWLRHTVHLCMNKNKNKVRRREKTHITTTHEEKETVREWLKFVCNDMQHCLVLAPLPNSYWCCGIVRRIATTQHHIKYFLFGV